MAKDTITLPTGVSADDVAQALAMIQSRRTVGSLNPCLCEQCTEGTWVADGPVKDERYVDPKTGVAHPYHRPTNDHPGDPDYGTQEGHWDQTKRKPVRAHHWFCDVCGSGPHSFDEKDLPAQRKQMRPRPGHPRDLVSPPVRYACGNCGAVPGGFELDGGSQAAPVGF